MNLAGSGNNGRAGRKRRRRPVLAEVGRRAEAGHRPHHRPVVGESVVLHLGRRPEAIRAVIPDAVVDQTAARVAAAVGLRDRFLRWGGVSHRQGLRIVADDHRVAGRGRLADGKAAGALGRAVGPGRVEVAVGRPGGIPGVAVVAVVVPPGEIDFAELRRLLEWAIFGAGDSARGSPAPPRRPSTPSQRAGRCRRRSGRVPEPKPKQTATHRKVPMRTTVPLHPPPE